MPVSAGIDSGDDFTSPDDDSDSSDDNLSNYDTKEFIQHLYILKIFCVIQNVRNEVIDEFPSLLNRLVEWISIRFDCSVDNLNNI